MALVESYLRNHFSFHWPHHDLHLPMPRRDLTSQVEPFFFDLLPISEQRKNSPKPLLHPKKSWLVGRISKLETWVSYHKGEDLISYINQNNQGRPFFYPFFIAPSQQSYISRVIGTVLCFFVDDFPLFNHSHKGHPLLWMVKLAGNQGRFKPSQMFHHASFDLNGSIFQSSKGCSHWKFKLKPNQDAAAIRSDGIHTRSPIIAV